MDWLIGNGPYKLNKWVLIYLIIMIVIAITFPSKLLSIVSGEEKGNKEVNFLVGNKNVVIQKYLHADYSIQEKTNVIYPVKEESAVVHLKVDGKSISFYTQDTTVAEVINSLDITLKPEDKVIPSLDSKISKTNHIIVNRVEEKLIKTMVTIPIPYKYVNSSQVALGKTIIKELGQTGLKEIVTKKVYVDGVLDKEYKVSERIVTQPKPLVYAIGGAVFRGQFLEEFTMLATAYGPPTVDRHVPSWITASGRRVAYGLVAVDPKVIPLGSKLWVENYGFAIAADTGSMIKGLRIDLFFFNSLKELNKFGKRYVTVYLLELPPPKKAKITATN